MNIWLRKSHPNFFTSFSAVIVLNVFLAQGAFADGGAAYYRQPSLETAVSIVSPFWWGMGFSIPVVLMVCGLFHPTFMLARVGLVLSMVIYMARAGFLMLAWIEGVPLTGGQWLWVFATAVVYAMAMEPPSNPDASKP